ncbi:unnamed protein product [Ostreobium quekettii]|uniref:Uncharacterized protein n=1 Tax=Ostreobium quekettii TaxID=121088 RepID=A0A8S1JDP5_9CHLO|nr:unnamed protein product [Ostreobium quekettii]|eukprot:evm.model.scf_117.12 EVM.evm.TU.scf_117.12   scf_117:96637-97185(-)
MADDSAFGTDTPRELGQWRVRSRAGFGSEFALEGVLEPEVGEGGGDADNGMKGLRGWAGGKKELILDGCERREGSGKENEASCEGEVSFRVRGAGGGQEKGGVETQGGLPRACCEDGMREGGRAIAAMCGPAGAHGGPEGPGVEGDGAVEVAPPRVGRKGKLRRWLERVACCGVGASAIEVV